MEKRREDDVQRRKEAIIQKLKENGCRITKQRMEILDIILEDQCSSCKEIYYRASEVDEKIGIATVYRMVNALEEIGVVSRSIVYRPEGALGVQNVQNIQGVPAASSSPAPAAPTGAEPVGSPGRFAQPDGKRVRKGSETEKEKGRR